MILSLLFPRECLHCHQPIRRHHLCPDCQGLLTPLPTQNRCWRCFAERPCKRCRDSLFARRAFSFPDYGPIRSLIGALPYQPHLAKGCAAYLALHLAALKFPTPTLIVPAPSTAPPHLARALANLLKRPLVVALKPIGRGHARLTRRKALARQTLLLVAERWPSHTEEWEGLLQSAKPERLYGIALCDPDADREG
ncbi:MAG: hypothetical protein AB7F31_06130 [Parachlamydiales bacterium]